MISAQTSTQSLEHEEGLVTIPIEANQIGKIRITRGGETIDLMAKSSDRLERGTPVLVIAVEDGIAQVCSLKVNKTKKIKQKKGAHE